MKAVPRQDMIAFADALSREQRLATMAAVVSLAAPLLWLPQAALVAAAVSALMGQPGIDVLPAAAMFVLLALLRALLEAHALGLSQRLSSLVRQALRERLVRHELQRAPAASQEDPGGLASLMGEGITQIGPWVERYRPASLRARVVPLVVVLAVLTQSWAAALALLLTGPLIPLFMALVGWAAQAASRAQLVETGALSRLLIDRVSALLDLRLLGAGEAAQQELATRAESLRQRTMKVLRLAFMSSAVLEFFASLGVALVAVHMGLSLLGLVHWGHWGEPSVFGGVFVLLIAADFYQPLRDLAAAWHDRAAGSAAAQRVDEMLARPGRMLGEGAAAPVSVPVGTLSWKDLELAAGSRRILLGDGHVAPAEAVALLGPSGAGKSTLLATLAGLLPAASGEVRFGEVLLDRNSAAAIRARMAWLPQLPSFPDSSLGAFLCGSGVAMDSAQLWQALRAARVDAVVAALPDGLETRLGERGGGVSGGEARRLFIARALLDPPNLLLADEPTADLDPDTAAEVADALLALRARGTGLLVATHDVALAARLDRVLNLAGGAP